MIDHLIDSSSLVDYLLNQRGVAEVRRLLEAGSLATSLIVYGEIYEGLIGLRSADQAMARFRDFVDAVDLLGVDVETAEEYGQLRSSLRVRGELLADNDLWIAATALRHNLTLVSRDVHFERVPRLDLIQT